jgi:hypothetical protein
MLVPLDLGSLLLVEGPVLPGVLGLYEPRSVLVPLNVRPVGLLDGVALLHVGASFARAGQSFELVRKPMAGLRP